MFDDLEDHWRTASKYVVHFSCARAPDKLEYLEPFAVDTASLIRTADHILAAVDQLVVAMEASSAPAADVLRRAVVEGRQSLIRMV